MDKNLCEVLIQIEDVSWNKYYNKTQWQKQIEEITNLILSEIHFNQYCEISILMTNDQTIQSLNKEYRKKDSHTNVLSFPIYSSEEQMKGDQHIMLGDVVLSLNTIEKEANDQKKSFIGHLYHLIVHGVLHLLGYDHETEEEAEKMEKIEILTLNKLNIKNPYI